MNAPPLNRVQEAVAQFVVWLDHYGETSHDHQSYYAGKIGRAAKALYYRHHLLGTLAVGPMVFSEGFVPSARRLFWKRQRLPIADAHYAMSFAFLAELENDKGHLQRAIHFLEVLLETRCPDYERFGWGYPFDWQTRTGIFPQGTPLITTTPYVYEAFSQVYAIGKGEKWLHAMQATAEHVFKDYRDMDISPGSASCSYTPTHEFGVINASAYRAFVLTKAAAELSRPDYLEVARKNLKFVLDSQNADGSWFYSMDGARDFVDHFHTCFVLKALAKIEGLSGGSDCRRAIEKGVEYYTKNLFDESGLPLPFSRRPRMTVYRRELYDYAECVNLGVLLQGRFPALDERVAGVTEDLLARWRKADGSFRSRELMFGWDNVPMHRWAQSQVFRSLCFLLTRAARKVSGEPPAGVVPIMASKGSR